MNIRTGQILWRERSMPRANTLLVGDQAILLDEEGVLHLAKLSPEKLTVISSFQHIGHPLLDAAFYWRNAFYVRDRKSIAAIELK